MPHERFGMSEAGKELRHDSTPRDGRRRFKSALKVVGELGGVLEEQPQQPQRHL